MRVARRAATNPLPVASVVAGCLADQPEWIDVLGIERIELEASSSLN